MFGRPSMGAWVTYGLGSESQNLPGFVVLSSAGGTSGGAGNWGAGFLPTVYQGVPFRRSGDPILYLSNPPGITDAMQRRSLDALQELNQERLGVVGDPEIATRINAFEMAYRMQTSAPELMDLAKESKETLEMYGAKFRAKVPSPTIACWPGAWWSAACASSSFSTRPGTITAMSPAASRTNAARPTNRARP
jgi:hypothetical protein